MYFQIQVYYWLCLLNHEIYFQSIYRLYKRFAEIHSKFLSSVILISCSYKQLKGNNSSVFFLNQMNSELIGLLLEDFKNRLENSVSQFIKYKGFL